LWIILRSTNLKGDYIMARNEYLPAPPYEVRLDLAILRADRNEEKKQLALNKVICSLHPHKALVTECRALRAKGILHRFWF
jgi:hypothetical protein